MCCPCRCRHCLAKITPKTLTSRQAASVPAGMRGARLPSTKLQQRHGTMQLIRSWALWSIRNTSIRQMFQRTFANIVSTGLVALAAATLHAQEMNGFDLRGALIPAGQIDAGGPARDGIPSIDKPRFLPAERATYM